MGKIIVSFFGFLAAWGVYMYVIDVALMKAQGLSLIP